MYLFIMAFSHNYGMKSVSCPMSRDTASRLASTNRKRMCKSHCPNEIEKRRGSEMGLERATVFSARDATSQMRAGGARKGLGVIVEVRRRPGRGGRNWVTKEEGNAWNKTWWSQSASPSSSKHQSCTAPSPLAHDHCAWGGDP